MNNQTEDFISLERIYPDQIDKNIPSEKEVLNLYIERYSFAAQHIKGKKVLDIACGSGYGTTILAQASLGDIKCIGVDIDKDVIEYAIRRHRRTGLDFYACNAMEFKSAEKFDTIVSIETIEHLPDPTAFIDHLSDLLADHGVIIASVPVTPSVDGNPYHLNDFTEKSFVRLFEQRGFILGSVLKQVQPFSPIFLTSKGTSNRLQNIRPHLINYYFTHPGSFVKRVWSTLRFGFTNRYLTAVWHTKTD